MDALAHRGALWRIGLKMGAVLTAVIGIAIMPWKLYNDAAVYLFTWLLGYGAMLGSVGGVMIADYFVVRRMRLDVRDLYRFEGRYRFSRGINPVAMTALVAGIVPNVPAFLAALGLVTVSPFWSTVYDWAWFVAFGISFAIHVVGMKLTTRGDA